MELYTEEDPFKYGFGNGYGLLGDIDTLDHAMTSDTLSNTSAAAIPHPEVLTRKETNTERPRRVSPSKRLPPCPGRRTSKRPIPHTDGNDGGETGWDRRPRPLGGGDGEKPERETPTLNGIPQTTQVQVQVQPTQTQVQTPRIGVYVGGRNGGEGGLTSRAVGTGQSHVYAPPIVSNAARKNNTTNNNTTNTNKHSNRSSSKEDGKYRHTRLTPRAAGDGKGGVIMPLRENTTGQMENPNPTPSPRTPNNKSNNNNNNNNNSQNDPLHSTAPSRPLSRSEVWESLLHVEADVPLSRATAASMDTIAQSIRRPLDGLRVQWEAWAATPLLLPPNRIPPTSSNALHPLAAPDGVEMGGGEEMEPHMGRHNILEALYYRERPTQRQYPVKMPLTWEKSGGKRRPRTPRSFYGPKGPAVGKDWFCAALNNVRLVKSPDLRPLELEEARTQKNKR